ncbi:hypothetical protein SGUI_2843 [Serinicoccus hydrothermalis]|uniref:DUF218 domain-containing protein n=1 Tax=Serinicoccus hydrothermalis TaxID=1758689 RepID=A0A1B1NFP4_9MICO|nr:YdcF family protein [Serinicoccus hydrothermalis]ANS80239.1 hypothetical protein SGUI_2843 [Serinicoccus hydrothermalis]
MTGVVLAPLGLVLPGLLLRYAGTRLARGRRDADTRGALTGGVATLLVPVVGLLLLGYASAPVLVGLGAGLILLAAWPGLVMVLLLARRWWLCRRPVSADRRAVIVLGAPVPDGEVGEELAARLRGGLTALARLTALGSGAVGAAVLPLVLTGGRARGERPAEAEAMARWVRAQDPETPLILEDRAATTEDNLLLSTRLLQEQGCPPPYAVVTSAYHAARTSLLVARHRLPLQVVGVRVPIDSPVGAYLRELLIVLKEARRPHLVAGLVVLGGALLAGVLAR